jgi:hypothetical protein
MALKSENFSASSSRPGTLAHLRSRAPLLHLLEAGLQVGVLGRQLREHLEDLGEMDHLAVLPGVGEGFVDVLQKLLNASQFSSHD